MTTPKYRRPLNDYQKDILLALYKFRFATPQLLIDYQNLPSPRHTYDRLANLVEQEYIGRNYDNNHKIDRKPSTYFLLPKGITMLKTMPNLNQKFFTNLYNDRRASPVFIDRCLTTFAQYNKLKKLYGKKLTFYSKSEMSEYGFFPFPYPDGFALIHDKPYLLEFVPAGIDYPALRRRLNKLVNHFEDESSPTSWLTSGLEFPTLLLICDNLSLERSAQNLGRKAIKRTRYENLNIYTATSKALFNAASPQTAIWGDALEPDALSSLQII